MIQQLPRWVFVGTWVLAITAGMVNVIGLLGFQHQTITHLTGTTTMLAAAAAQAQWQAVGHFAALIGAFFLGCVFSGVLLRDSALKLGRRYGLALLIVALLLFLSIPLLEQHGSFGLYTAACACGIQNAMVSTYSGAVVRITHLSGMFTDLGLYLGHALRGLPVNQRRLTLCLLVISGFSLGGLTGAWAYLRIAHYALALPGGLTLAAALGYIIWGQRFISKPASPEPD